MEMEKALYLFIYFLQLHQEGGQKFQFVVLSVLFWHNFLLNNRPSRTTGQRQSNRLRVTFPNCYYGGCL